MNRIIGIIYLVFGLLGFLPAVSNLLATFNNFGNESYTSLLLRYFLGLKDERSISVVLVIIAFIFLILSISSFLTGVYMLRHDTDKTVKTAERVFFVGFVILFISFLVFGIIPCIFGPPDGLCMLGGVFIIPPLFVLISVVGFIIIAVARFRTENLPSPPPQA